MPKAKLSKKQSKAHFVRNLPHAMAALEIIEKGKAAGLKLSKNYIYRVRTEINAKSRARAASRTGETPRAPSKRPPTTKAAFVRSLPSSMPAKEVIARARSAGFSVSKTYVYVVRSWHPAAAKKKSAAKATTSKPTPIRRGPSSAVANAAVGNVLKALAAEVGLGRAIELLQTERDRVQSILKR